jgi:hypothetical protein
LAVGRRNIAQPYAGILDAIFLPPNGTTRIMGTGIAVGGILLLDVGGYDVA